MFFVIFIVRYTFTKLSFCEANGLVSLTLKAGPVPKVLPMFCGLFKIVQKVGPVPYRLYLPTHSGVHLVFHVSHLRKSLCSGESRVDKSVLVECGNPSTTHEPNNCRTTICDALEITFVNIVCSSGKI